MGKERITAGMSRHVRDQLPTLAQIQLHCATKGVDAVDVESASDEVVDAFSYVNKGIVRTVTSSVYALFFLLPFIQDLTKKMDLSFLTFGFIAIDDTVCVVLEIFCLVWMLIDVRQHWKMYGFGLFTRQKWVIVRGVVALLNVFGLPAYYDPEYVRFFWSLRPLVVVSASPVASANFEAMLKSVPKVLPLVIFIFFWLVVMALIGYITLDNAAETSGFYTYKEALWNNMLMFHSMPKISSFINAMISDNYFYSLYFVFYILIGKIFLFKLMVAQVMKTFNARMVTLYKDTLSMRDNAAWLAFHNMADVETINADREKSWFISKSAFVSLMTRVAPRLGSDGATSVFNAVDTNDSGDVSYQEFTSIFWVLDAHWTRVRNPRDFLWRAYKNNHGRTNLWSFFMFVRKLCYVACTESIDILTWDNINILDATSVSLLVYYIVNEDADWVITFFWVENFMKIFAYGISNYFASGLYKLDFFCLVIWQFDSFFQVPGQVMVFLVVGSRLLKASMALMMLIKDTRETFQIIAHVFHFLAQFFLVYIAVVYFFAMLSYDVYHGVLQDCNVNECDPRLEGTGWSGKSAHFNFDTVTNALVALFYMPSAGQHLWPVALDGYRETDPVQFHFTRFWFWGYITYMRVIVVPLGLAAVVALWKAFADHPVDYVVNYGDFQAAARSSDLYILRRVYGEKVLRDIEGRKLTKNDSDADNYYEYHHAEYQKAREKELASIQADIAFLMSELKNVA